MLLHPHNTTFHGTAGNSVLHKCPDVENPAPVSSFTISTNV